MGAAGRKRAAAEFGWDAIAAQTVGLYAELTGSPRTRPGPVWDHPSQIETTGRSQ